MTANKQEAPAIRPALSNEITELSQLRLEALQTEPAAFTRDYEADRKNSAADWET